MKKSQPWHKFSNRGFTLVEILIVILVIGILASIMIIAYGSWRKDIAEKAVKSDLSHAASAMYNTRNESNGYPAQLPSGYQASANNTVTLVRSNFETFCINGSNAAYPSSTYFIDEKSGGTAQAGSCSPLQLSIDTMSIASNHACYLNTARKVYCWGNNDKGQAGDGTIGGSKSTPVQVSRLGADAIQSIATGSGGHSCAATTSGLAYCWGANNYGQLGNGTTNNSAFPVEVTSTGVLMGERIQSISAGDNYTCALTLSGKVYCWGYGVNGRLGNGQTSNSSLPVAVVTSGSLSGKKVKSIASGWTHTCVIASDDQPYCWGYGGYGAIGNGGAVDALAPTAVLTSGVLNGKTSQVITSGYDHSCVIASDNRAYCWGWNYYGQIGNASTSVAQTPTAVTTTGSLNNKSLKDINGGRASTCALTTDNLVSCWGDNSGGMLGLGTAGGYMTSPAQANLQGSLAGKTVKKLFVGHNNTCAVATDNSLHCWGEASWGMLGNGATSQSLVPSAVGI